MAEDLIRYDILAQDALRGVVRKVLSEVARTGLPGEHHFYISFATRAPGVRVSSRILERYPEEMTIVLQHQFWDLSVTEHAFEVGVSFGGAPERLLVPFTAIKAFVDPSVQFALQFDPADLEAEAELSAIEAVEIDEPEFADAEPAKARPLATPRAEPAAEAAPDKGKPPQDGAAQVVSLDAFRKKQ